MKGFDPASIIAGGVGGVFDYLGAKKQADAIKQASAQQADSTQKALDFTKQQYYDLTGRLSPYVQSGQTANNYASALLGNSPYLKAVRGTAPASAPVSVGAGQTPAAAAASPGAMVTLRAPDGSTRQFAANDPIVAKAQAAGAQMVTA